MITYTVPTLGYPNLALPIDFKLAVGSIWFVYVAGADPGIL